MGLLQAENITKILPLEVPVTLVDDVSVTVDQGEFLAISGPSGSGKSSLLYLLGLLDRPTEGRILVAGEDICELSDDSVAEIRLRSLGFVFQSHFLLPEFSALENVMLPMRRLGKLREAELRRRAEVILRDLGLEQHCDKQPRQMSGGQCQRVAIARALANDPALILADEPTGNLDSAASEIVHKLLKDLAYMHNRAVVVVTHDENFAAMADRQIHIVDGKIV